MFDFSQIRAKIDLERLRGNPSFQIANFLSIAVDPCPVFKLFGQGCGGLRGDIRLP